jgi:hypothetical protein
MALSIHAVLQRHRRRLLATPGVVGAAVGERDGRSCITVYIDPAAAAPPAGLPPTLEGYAVVVEPTGPFRAAGPD